MMQVVSEHSAQTVYLTLLARQVVGTLTEAAAADLGLSTDVIIGPGAVTETAISIQMTMLGQNAC